MNMTQTIIDEVNAIIAAMLRPTVRVTLDEGVVDEGFTGEVVVKLYNHGPRFHRFRRGDKITQLVIVPVLYPTYEQADEIAGGERGDAGYGSTGR